jgi:hypothetical protein
VTGLGKLASKVPEAVAKELNDRTFREFCLFNIDAELTAAIAWERLIEVAQSIGDETASLVKHVDRMRIDEDNHRKIFELIADIFTEDDQLKAGVEFREVRDGIAAISPYFLTPTARPSFKSSPIGKGGTIFIHRGQPSDDKARAFSRFLVDCRFQALLQEKAEISGTAISDLKIVIKTSFMMGYHHRDRCALIDAQLLKMLGQKLISWGCSNVTVIESGNVYNRFFKNREVLQVAQYFGLESPFYKIAETGMKLVPHKFHRGMAESVSWI